MSSGHQGSASNQASKRTREAGPTRKVAEAILSSVATAFGFAAAIVSVPCALAVVAVRRLSGFATWTDGAARAVARAIPATFGIATRVTGLGRLPGGGEGPIGAPVIIMANHVNIFDGFLLRGGLPLAFRAVELDRHFAWPVYGTAMRLHGNIPIPHGSPRAALGSLQKAMRVLAEGTPLVVLPEGHRTRDGRLQRFMLGPFRLAREAGATIVPVYLDGAFERQQTGSLLVQPGTVYLRIGEPIPADVVRSLDERSLRDRVRARFEQMAAGSTA